MAITKKLLVFFIMITAFNGSINATDWTIGYDKAALKALVEETKVAFDGVVKSFEATKAVYGSKIKKYEKDVRNRKKDQMKLIMDRLKNAYKMSRTRGEAFIAGKQLYKAYKELVYAGWEKTGLLPQL